MAIARGLRAFLAVALLFAWTNALVHPVAHVDAAGAFVHLADGHGDGKRNDRAPDPLCDAIAALAACVDASPKAVVDSPQGSEAPVSAQAGTFSGASLLAYRSQAPPQFS